MNISITNGNISHSVNISDYATRDEVLVVFKRLMMCAEYGFSDEDVEDIITKSEEIILGPQWKRSIKN